MPVGAIVNRILLGTLGTFVALGVAACGGGGSNGPTAPTPTPGPAAPAVTIAIVGDRGAQSFAPNPASLGQNPTFGWRNDDNATHRIVANDGSFDTGNIAPGATSRALPTPAGGTNYHCSLHPGMIGSVGVAGQAPPPCSGVYC